MLEVSKYFNVGNSKLPKGEEMLEVFWMVIAVVGSIVFIPVMIILKLLKKVADMLSLKLSR